ncbi:MAG: hypothetical protein ACXAEN_19295 [Candidatus Thorarchaeota archaeon]|jgi:hypothetical protein
MTAPKNETVVVRLKSGEVRLGVLLDGKNWYIEGAGFVLGHVVHDWAPLPFSKTESGPWVNPKDANLEEFINVSDPAQAPDSPLLDQRMRNLQENVKDASLEEFIDDSATQILAGVSGLPDMILGYNNNEPQGIAFTVRGDGMLEIIEEFQLGGCNKIVIGVYEGSLEVPLDVVMYASPI